MNLDQFKPLTVYTIYIASTPERVWEALTSAEFSRSYFSGFAVEMEPRLGGKFMVRAPDGAEHICGEVLEHDPPKKLSVTYEIEPAGEAVRLTMSERHDRPLSDDILEGGRTGWPAILSGLKSLLETGKAPQIKMSPPVKMLEALKAMGIKTP